MNKKYNCEVCKYYTDNKYDFSRHLSTKKHQCIQSEIYRIKKNVKMNRMKCEYCGKHICRKKNIKRHYKKCKKYENYKIKKEKDHIIQKLMEELKKEKEKMNELKENNKQLKNDILRLKKSNKKKNEK